MRHMTIFVFSNLFAVSKYGLLYKNRVLNDKNQTSQHMYAGQSIHSGQSWEQDPHALVTNYERLQRP